MNSKAVQLLLTLGLVTTLGACGGGGEQTPADSGTTGDATEETTPAETSPEATPEGEEGGEGGEEGGEG